jgi:DNA/RNA-binding domain of Phe-tRNA-synthetase-like protein
MRFDSRMISATERWKVAYPGAAIGVLAMSPVANPDRSLGLETHRQAVEGELRSTFASLDRSQIKAHPQVAPYTAYYKRFDKTYHVQHQLESIVFKGKSIPQAAAMVEAMFVAELKNMLLTAGHDLAAVRGQLVVDIASGAERYDTLRGRQEALKPGDMFICDEEGILSSIIYGPDHRTRITPATTRVLFTVYAPAGVPADKLRTHLGDLRRLVLAVSPEAQVEYTAVLAAGS